MLNAIEIRDLFQYFNGYYFGRRLPPYVIRVTAYITSVGELGRCLRKHLIIEIAQNLPTEQAVSTLLHAMPHAATVDHHGKAWKDEMVRLRDAGAPLQPSEFQDFDGWTGESVTEEHFRDEAVHYIGDDPTMTLSRAIKVFIANQGGDALTIKAFLKLHPWATAIFKEAQIEVAERHALKERSLQAQVGATL